jgi:hypothetical protein
LAICLAWLTRATEVRDGIALFARIRRWLRTDISDPAKPDPVSPADGVEDDADPVQQATVTARSWLRRAPLAILSDRGVATEIEAGLAWVLDTDDAVHRLAMAAVYSEGMSWTHPLAPFPRRYRGVLERNKFFNEDEGVKYSGSVFRTDDKRVLIRWDEGSWFDHSK